MKPMFGEANDRDTPSFPGVAMRYLTRSVIAAMLLFAAPAAVRAQLVELQPGMRIRVEAPGIIAGRLAGTVLSRTGDSLDLAAPNGVPMRIATARLTKIEVSRGKSRMEGAKRGLMWGVPILGGFSTLIAVATPACPASRCGIDGEFPKGEFVMWGFISGAMYGAGIGALIGREKWDRYDLPARPAVGLRDGRATLGVSHTF